MAKPRSNALILTIDRHFAFGFGPVVELDLVLSLVPWSNVEDSELDLPLGCLHAALLAWGDLLAVLEPLGFAALKLGLAHELHATFLLVDLDILQGHDNLDSLLDADEKYILK